MLSSKNQLFKKSFTNNGDTIVEVLISIAVAAFAIGTAYAIANKSLERSITARERNEALNIIDTQISLLKQRHDASENVFNSDDNDKRYVVKSTYTPPGGVFPGTDFHFCIRSVEKDPTAAAWDPKKNIIQDDQLNNLQIASPGGYNSQCVINSPTGDARYFTDISAQLTSSSQGRVNPTVYKVSVRWNTVSSDQIGNATVYYRF